MPMRGAPKCKLCGHQHDLREPHVFDGPKKPLTPVREAEAPLTPVDLARLGELEAIIMPGLDTWIMVGQALTEIREQRLYRAEAKTFEEYCQTRWQMSRQYANRLIGSSAVAKVLDATIPAKTLPSAHALRPLVPLLGEPEKVREVWDATVARVGPRPSGAAVKETITKPEAGVLETVVSKSGAAVKEMIAMQAPPSIDVAATDANFATVEPDAPNLEPKTGDSPATDSRYEALAPAELQPGTPQRVLEDGLGLPPGALDPPPLTYADVHYALERSAGALAEAAELLEDLALSSRDRRDLLGELDSFGRAISRLQQLIQVKA